MTITWYRNFEKGFLNCKKMSSRKVLSTSSYSNHTVFLILFEMNLHLQVFQKAEIALAKFDKGVLISMLQLNGN